MGGMIDYDFLQAFADISIAMRTKFKNELARCGDFCRSEAR